MHTVLPPLLAVPSYGEARNSALLMKIPAFKLTNTKLLVKLYSFLHRLQQNPATVDMELWKVLLYMASLRVPFVYRKPILILSCRNLIPTKLPASVQRR
jgi:hypothetical protein